MYTDYYVFLYTPGPNWLPGQSVTEQPLASHFQYMNHLEATHRLVLGGAFVDDSGAMGILHVSNLDEAHMLVLNDPAVLAGVVQATVHPFYVIVAGTITTSG